MNEREIGLKKARIACKNNETGVCCEKSCDGFDVCEEMFDICVSLQLQTVPCSWTDKDIEKLLEHINGVTNE